MNIFCDLHHTALFYSLQLLFEKRLGYKLFRPAGREWFDQGYWCLYPGVHPSTADQYLTLSTSFKRDVHGFELPPRMKLNEKVEYNDEDGIFYIEDPSTKKVHRGITLEKFKNTKFDILISSVPSHIPIWNRLIAEFQPQAKHIFQVGNAWGHQPGVQNILSSTAPYPVPCGTNVFFYHQEFDLDLFKYAPPTNHKKVYSFIHYMRNPDLLQQYRNMLMPAGWSFFTYGAGMESDLCYMGDIAGKMQEMGWSWVQKPEGDGYGHCYSQDTEILTENGWKFFPELKTEDRVATLNPDTGALEYQSPIQYQAFEYKGNMCHFKSRILDVLVTPNHRMWIEQYDDTSKSLGWRFTEAQTLFNINKSPRHRIGIKVAANNWQGSDTCSIEWARFLGWYLAEGCTSKTVYKSKVTGENKIGGKAICIANTNLSYLEEIKTLLSPLKQHQWSIHKSGNAKFHTGMVRKNGEPCPAKQGYVLRIPSNEFYDKFIAFGTCNDKYIPPEILNGNRNILHNFLEAFVLGDGHIDQRIPQTKLRGKLTRVKREQSVELQNNIHHISGRFSTSLEINIAPKKMIDQLQEIAIKLGFRSRVRRKKPSGVGKQLLWSINITTTLSASYSAMLNKRKLYGPTKEIPYDGMVYCVTVPNSLVFTRRNGIPVVSGNSIHSSYACGRPAIININHYKGKLGEQLLIDGSTCVDISTKTVHEASGILNKLARPDEHTRMCENAYNRFRQVVNFDAEFEGIKDFLGRLR